MSEQLGRAVLVLSTEDGPLKQGLKDAETKLTAFAGRAASVLKGVGVAAAAAGTGVLAMMHQTLQLADQLNKLSQRTGISVESLSALRHAARLADVSIEDFTVGMRGLNQSIIEARDPTSRAAQVFRALGVYITQGAEVALRGIADAFARLPDGATKSAASIALFNRSGDRMIPLLNAGSRGLDDARKEAERFGTIISTQTARDAETFNDNVTRLRDSTSALGIAIANHVLPTLVRWSEFLVRVRTDTSELGRALAELAKSALHHGPNILMRMLPMGQAMRGLVDIGRAALAPGKGPVAEGTIRRGAEAAPDAGVQAQVDALNRALAGGANAATERVRTAKDAMREFDEMSARSQLLQLERLEQIAQAAELLAESERAAERARDSALITEAYDAQMRALNELAAIERRRHDAEVDRLEGVAQRWRDVIEPANVYIRQLNDIDAAERMGIVTAELAAQVRSRIAEEAERNALAIDRVVSAQERLDDVTRQLGLTFTSAFEDAVIRGRRLSEVIRGIGDDILRMIIRRQVTEPLVGAVSGMLGGSGIVGALRGLIGFAGGGYTGSGARIGGLDGRGGFLAMLHPRETVVDHERGGAPVSISQTYHIGAGVSRAEVIEAVRAGNAHLLETLRRSRTRGGAFA